MGQKASVNRGQTPERTYSIVNVTAIFTDPLSLPELRLVNLVAGGLGFLISEDHQTG